MTRLTLRLSDEQERLLERLRQRLDASSAAEVFEKLLARDDVVDKVGDWLRGVDAANAPSRATAEDYAVARDSIDDEELDRRRQEPDVGTSDEVFRRIGIR